MERTYITVRQAADAVHVTTTTIRRWFAAGRLTKYTIGGRVLVDAAELEQKITPAPAVTGAAS